MPVRGVLEIQALETQRSDLQEVFFGGLHKAEYLSLSSPNGTVTVHTASIRRCCFTVSSNAIDNNLCFIHLEYMIISLAKGVYFAQFRGIRIFLPSPAILFLALHGSKCFKKGRDKALLTYTNI